MKQIFVYCFIFLGFLSMCSPKKTNSNELSCKNKAEGVYKLKFLNGSKYLLLDPNDKEIKLTNDKNQNFTTIYLVNVPAVDGYTNLFAISSGPKISGFPSGAVLTKSKNKSDDYMYHETWAKDPNDQRRQIWCIDTENGADRLRNMDDGCLTIDGWKATHGSCPPDAPGNNKLFDWLVE